MGAASADSGSVSSESLSPSDGAVFETIPYVAYLCGWDRINESLTTREIFSYRHSEPGERWKLRSR